MKAKRIFKLGSSGLLFFMILVVTVFLQISRSPSADLGSTRPNAELELESLDQVQEINDGHFKFYELKSSDELLE